LPRPDVSALLDLDESIGFARCIDFAFLATHEREGGKPAWSKGFAANEQRREGLLILWMGKRRTLGAS